MNRASAGYDTYRSDFADFSRAFPANGSGWLSEARESALQTFDDLGFPTSTRGNERWKYTNVAPIARAEFHYPFEVEPEGVSLRQLKSLVAWGDSWTRLVFVDGVLSRQLSTREDSTDSARIVSLADALSRDGAVVEDHLGRLADVGDDGFTAVNTAFLRDGAFVHVPDESSLDSPVHLVFVTTARPQPTVSHPRVLLVVGKHSKLTVLESYVSLSEGSYFTNAVTEIVAGDGSQIEHYRYLMEGAGAFHIGTTRVRLGHDSSFSSASFARGARIARNDLNVLLDAPGSSCVLNGLYTTSGTQHIDNHIDVDHAQPHGSSDQLFKGILADESRAVFSGRVLVRPNAQKTYARQADKNLLLSDGARVNTKPSLEIYADDVQCFHGATAGAVAEDALFYMRSRGLDEEAARSLLVYGFASEIIERVRLDPLRTHLDRLFSGAALPTNHTQGSE